MRRAGLTLRKLRGCALQRRRRAHVLLRVMVSTEGARASLGSALAPGPAARAAAPSQLRGPASRSWLFPAAAARPAHTITHAVANDASHARGSAARTRRRRTCSGAQGCQGWRRGWSWRSGRATSNAVASQQCITHTHIATPRQPNTSPSSRNPHKWSPHKTSGSAHDGLFLAAADLGHLKSRSDDVGDVGLSPPHASVSAKYPTRLHREIRGRTSTVRCNPSTAS